MSDTEMENDHISENEMEEEEVDEPQAASPASKKDSEKGGRKSGGGSKKVSKTPTKRARSSGRKEREVTPKSASTTQKSKAKGRGSPKSGGKEKEEWEVEEIIGVKRESKGKEFLVKWKGWSGAPTWEPERNVSRCEYLIQNFIDSL